MAPARHSLLVLLGLAASIHAVPAPVPEQERRQDITLLPPSFSISWDPPLPTSDPQEPTDPPFPPVPETSDQISLNPPTYSVSWDGPLPPKTKTRKPWPRPTKKTTTTNGVSMTVSWGKRQEEDPTTSDPDPTDGPDPTDFPTPPDQISLLPPSFSISWDGPLPPNTKTKKPRPTKKTTSTYNPVTASISWGKRQEDDAEPTDFPESPDDIISLGPPSYTISWDGPQPPKTKTKKPRPTKKTTSTKGKVTATISWGKRQEEEPTDFPEPTEIPEPTDVPVPTDQPEPEPEPTDDPEPAPEEPGSGPIIIPPFVFPTPKNSIGLGKPTATIIWGKRQEEDPEPTEVPQPTEPTEDPEPVPTDDPEDPGDGQNNQPQDTFGLGHATATVIWGKRDRDTYTTYPPPIISLGEPTVTIWWPKPPKHTSNGYISWGKRQDEISNAPPTASISWGKRDDADYPTPTWWLGDPSASFAWPKPPKHTSAYISWGKRQDEEEPTEVVPPVEDPEPTEVVPPVEEPTDEISLNPPTATISWGKRDEADYPPPTWWLGDPTATVWWPKPPKHTSNGYISWGKRQDDEPTLPPDFPTPPNEISMIPPTASISWGKKRNDADWPWPTWWLGHPTASFAWPKPPEETSGYISWGKRDTPPNTWGIVWPTNIPKPTFEVPPPPQQSNVYVSWGKRDAAPEPTAPAELVDAVPASTCGLTTTVTRPIPCPAIACIDPCRAIDENPDDTLAVLGEPSAHPSFACPVTVTATRKCPTCGCPTTIISKPRPTPTSSACPTITQTIVPPCIPPYCPQGLSACRSIDVPEAKREEAQEVREVEKRIVTIKTYTPTGTPTTIFDRCTPYPTKTIYVGCPTYTCVPTCDAALRL